MAYTAHGHHIPGTLKGEGVTTAPPTQRCGGVEICPKCKQDVETHWFMVRQNVDYPEKAKELVRQYAEPRMPNVPAGAFDVYVIWFTKTLRNWKAVLGTTLPDGMLYEVTHNGDKHETYVDAYKKIENVVIPD